MPTIPVYSSSVPSNAPFPIRCHTPEPESYGQMHSAPRTHRTITAPPPTKIKGFLALRIISTARSISSSVMVSVWRSISADSVLIFALSRSHILGNIHQNRAGPAVLGDGRSPADDLCQPVHILDNKVILGNRHGNTRNVDFLEAVFSQKALVPTLQVMATTGTESI